MLTLGFEDTIVLNFVTLAIFVTFFFNRNETNL